jgi:RNA polymerase sigma factor (sigma-70 family)
MQKMVWKLAAHNDRTNEMEVPKHIAGNEGKTGKDRLLAEALKNGAIAGALRKVHVGCRRIIYFEDFSHEVLLRSLGRWSSFSGNSEGELVSWVKAIGQNLMIDLLRKSKHKHTKTLSPQIADTSQISPLETLARFEDALWLKAEMEGLDEFDLRLINLRYFEKMTWLEISRIVNVKQNTLIQRHLRMLEKLRNRRIQRDGGN